MFVLTPAERRGAALVAVLLLIGAGHDLWRFHHPRRAIKGLDRTSTAADTSVPPAASAPLDPTASAAPLTTAKRIDLNAANRTDLESLPGIGPVLAGRILEHRARSGRFRSQEELLTVRGIGPRLYARLADRIRVAPPADSTAGR